MQQLKLLWIDVDAGESGGASRKLFERLFKVIEVSQFELITGHSEARSDVICFNFDYPAMVGLTLIPEAKKRWPSSPILLLTQQNSAELALWALRSRVFDLLVKPARTDEVERTFERVTAAVHARRGQTERKLGRTMAPPTPPISQTALTSPASCTFPFPCSTPRLFSSFCSSISRRIPRARRF